VQHTSALNELETETPLQARILIADDDPRIRQLIRRLLEEEKLEWKVCGEAVDGPDAVAKSVELFPDVVVLDLVMPQMNGLEAGREIIKRFPRMQMLLLTLQEITPELARAAGKVGFQGAISKTTGANVVAGIQTLLCGKPFFQISAEPATLPEPHGLDRQSSDKGEEKPPSLATTTDS